MNMGGNMNTDGSMTGVPTINNQTFDINCIDETVATGATEIWEFDGFQSTEPHAMHIHAVQFQVLVAPGAGVRCSLLKKVGKILFGLGQMKK